VLGPELGMALVENTAGVEAVIIDKQNRRLESKGLKGGVHWQ